MTFHVELSKDATKAIKKMDWKSQAAIVSWIDKNLEGCENPRAKGKALSGNLKGIWSYRVGEFRILADIEDDRLIILLVSIGNRRNVYDV